MRQLTDAEVAAASEALLGPNGKDLREAVFEFGLGLPVTSDKGLAMAQDLGWIADGAFTELGHPIGDPLREYVFWERRDGMLLSSDLVPRLAAESYRGQRVIELGSGGGCNLLSLSGVPERLVGLEPMPAYLQMTPVLAEMAGLPVPETVQAAAEDIPFGDGEFDVALCYSSHQYMDLHQAIAEMGRVVRPGGEAIVIGGRLWPFLPETAMRFVRSRSLGTLKYDLRTIANTAGYTFTGRRPFMGSSSGSTGSPIYPTTAWMKRQLAKHGFGDMAVTRLPGSEAVIIAKRR
ncbi:MAG: class I SAM-dependent methyltransferase [Actinomycetota bacterium]